NSIQIGESPSVDRRVHLAKWCTFSESYSADNIAGMARPLIGITTDTHDDGKQYESPYAYSIAVEKAGGIPVLLPYKVDLSVIPELVDRLDGIVFSGGNDLDPVAYGQTYAEGTVPVDPLREKFERALMTEVEKRRVPTLGICMGSQLMNI